MWCCGEVKTRDDKEIKVDVKWNKEFVACGKSEEDEQLLKKYLSNPKTPKKGALRQDMREILKKILIT